MAPTWYGKSRAGESQSVLHSQDGLSMAEMGVITGPTASPVDNTGCVGTFDWSIHGD